MARRGGWLIRGLGECAAIPIQPLNAFAVDPQAVAAQHAAIRREPRNGRAVNNSSMRRVDLRLVLFVMLRFVHQTERPISKPRLWSQNRGRFHESEGPLFY